jgi:hypothetical protein
MHFVNEAGTNKDMAYQHRVRDVTPEEEAIVKRLFDKCMVRHHKRVLEFAENGGRPKKRVKKEEHTAVDI